MNEDLKELLKLLTSRGVEYLVIGAHALAFYGFSRYTEDFDVWVGRTQENTSKLAKVLQDFGIPMAPGGEEAFTRERQMIRLGLPPNRIDILNFGPDIPFEEAWARRVDMNLEGLTLYVISREDFVRAKRDAGRPKDLRDLEEMGEL